MSPTKLAAVGIAATLAFTGLIGSPAAHAAPADDATTRAAAWLGGQFTEGQSLPGYDGTTPDAANTIDGILALVATGEHDMLVTSATDWVASQAADLAATPTGAARAAILADATGRDASDFGGVDLVSAMQGELGDAAANPYGLGLLVIGLERNDTEVPAEVIDALLATQDREGWFGFPDFGVDIDSTAVAALALSSQTENEAATAAAQKATDWLVANQCTETSEQCPEVGAYWGSWSPVNTSGLVIPVLKQARVDASAQTDWLVAQQEADGGFPPAFGAGYSDAYATAQALLGLAGSSLLLVGGSSGFAVTPAIIAGLVVVALVAVAAVVLLGRRKKHA